MVTCGCGKTIDKVPTWLAGTKVEFVCTNCPNRQIKPISQLAMETAQAAALAEKADVKNMDELVNDDEDE